MNSISFIKTPLFFFFFCFGALAVFSQDDEKSKFAVESVSGNEGTVAIDIAFKKNLKNGLNSSNKKFKIFDLGSLGELTAGCNKSQSWFKWKWKIRQKNGKKIIGMSILLPDIKSDTTYSLLFSWNGSKGFFDVYLNGYPARVAQTTLPTWENSEIFKLKVSEGPFKVLKTIILHSYTPPKKVPKITPPTRINPFTRKSLDDPIGKLKFSTGNLIYDSNKIDPQFRTWIKEGPVKYEYQNNWAIFSSKRPNNENGKNGHIVWWCPKKFPESFIAEWDVKIISEYGLCIVFFASQGVDGESIFDDKLPKRNGAFTQYTKGKIRSYHISYHTNAAHNPGRSQVNLRKNNSFCLLAQGANGLPADKKVHKVTLIKNRTRIIMAIDGAKVLDFTDNNPKRFDKAYKDGWFGLRQMSWTVGQYRNLKVWELVSGKEKK